MKMAISNISKDYYYKNVVQNNINVPANSFAEVRIDASWTGYKPIGVLNITKNGGSNVFVVPSSWYQNNNDQVVYLRNTTANAINGISLIVTILYEKIQ